VLQCTDTSRFHEHLNFSAETSGACAPASIARPACSCTRYIVPDIYNKFAGVVPVPASIPKFLLLESFHFTLRPRISSFRAQPANLGNCCSDDIFSR